MPLPPSAPPLRTVTAELARAVDRAVGFRPVAVRRIPHAVTAVDHAVVMQPGIATVPETQGCPGRGDQIDLPVDCGLDEEIARGDGRGPERRRVCHRVAEDLRTVLQLQAHCARRGRDAPPDRVGAGTSPDDAAVDNIDRGGGDVGHDCATIAAAFDRAGVDDLPSTGSHEDADAPNTACTWPTANGSVIGQGNDGAGAAEIDARTSIS
ncbi:hypothetical protein [Mesorhizobium sp. M2E.F.Ca.ET.209.01.1.1]|uniref:hypothetical protein n=1 Tax=Mesorhizobium sp. M2E.F.Ca.ET.209.01.1.1 TaxID=2500526 RepID=UPI0016747F00|nr:hypothetical protein [Mesorhizobium sp. M2E.F.Ca.ET.209.01.1.1]